MKMRVDMIVEVPDTWDSTTVESAIENAIEWVEDDGTEVVRIVDFVDTYEI
jgi:hypothetical protein